MSEEFWVMLPPPSEGEHVLKFGGGFCNPGETEPCLSVDVTYNLTIIDDDDDDDDD